MSFGSAATSCSSTSAAFSHLDLLRCSATSSFSFRTSTWGALAIRVFVTLVAGPCLAGAAGANERSAALTAPPRPAARRGRTVAVAPRGKRHRPRTLGRLGLLPRLRPQQLHFGAGQLAQLPGAHPGDADTAVIGPMQLLHRRAGSFHQALDEVLPPFRDH